LRPLHHRAGVEAATGGTAALSQQHHTIGETGEWPNTARSSESSGGGRGRTTRTSSWSSLRVQPAARRHCCRAGEPKLGIPHGRARGRGLEPFVAENRQLAAEGGVAGNQPCWRRPTTAGTAAGGAGIGRRRPQHRLLGFALEVSVGARGRRGEVDLVEESEEKRPS
jgi:hypothetical protein